MSREAKYQNATSNQAAVFYPPSFKIVVESAPVPKIEDSDDAIVEVELGGLCGSDLHIYRGHQGFTKSAISGHEFIGTVVALGSSFSASASAERPHLYSTLKVGDKVISPFTVSCGECQFCRIGFTCRCAVQILFGIPTLPGGQAQYVRVPKAGGTLFSMNDFQDAKSLHPSSLLLMSDILPTGVFAATQLLQHAKLQPMLSKTPYPCTSQGDTKFTGGLIDNKDCALTIGIVGLGPVGLCATVALLDTLATRQADFRVVAIDLNESRRTKAKALYSSIDPDGRGTGEFVVASPEEAKELTGKWTSGVGLNGVLEVVGHTSALTLAYDLIRPFGVITSVGVHTKPPLPFTGQQMYDKNVSLDFGRCPVRALFPIALELLVKRQDVFGTVGEESSLVDRIMPLSQAAEAYVAFDKGLCGKVLFDPWA